LIVKVKDISVVRSSKYLLKGINWSVEEGEHWAILGLNGSGKTTLLNMINGYLFPSEGELQVLGNTFGRCDIRELRKNIGWVSTSIQEKLYINEFAEDIVLCGKYASTALFDEPEKEDRDRASYLLQLFDCSDLAKRIYKSLSQGEKQKILIARGLMSSPRLLILDEPCTGLDIFAKEQLLSIIEKLSHEKSAPTLIYVTHRAEEILPMFSHTLLLRRGEVHSSGKTDTVITSDNLSDFFETPIACEYMKSRYSINLE